jgi:uncharacterized protein (TIGR03435 family)
MRIESQELLAVGIFGSKSRVGDRIEILLRRGRTFSPRASFAGVIASTLALRVLTLAGSLTPHWIAFAQGPARPSFEVASVKPNKGSSHLVHMQPSPGGRFNAENVTLRILMQYAYDVKEFQIYGGPEWTNTERYDAAAKAEGSPTGQQMMGPMLQTLLEDRFKLAVHRETRQLPLYALTVAGSGVKLRPSKEGTCIHWSLYTLNTASSPLPAPGEKAPVFCGFRGFGVEGLDRTLDMPGSHMAELAASLSMALRRDVIDRTGLGGEFDIRLNWAIEAPATPGATPDLSPDAPRTSLFTSLREQLGLKLESAKGPVEVLVIDHAEKPDAN